uniref:all trans-polyprenyl-diphosphate synthase PDSS1-like isoform X1 n=2 Tax=Styela clava TaxID=7725 RepID=UPI001939A542|nr:all trans-polyprenyl-diphosphate synthase PDSS1-like isoform X1 [Styela clava]
MLCKILISKLTTFPVFELFCTPCILKPQPCQRIPKYISGKNQRLLHTDIRSPQNMQQRLENKSAYENLLKEDMNNFFSDIRKVMDTEIPLLQKMCHYYFDSTGKSIRPKIVLLTARACNNTSHTRHQSSISSNCTEKQRKIAMISEMIHTGSLIHDDVVDVSSIRRGKNTVNDIWGDRNAVLAGNYVLSRASYLTASIGETEIVTLIARIIDDLVRGEFMQIDTNANFDHYLKKTYRKTASLIANSCKAVAFLSNCDNNTVEAMYEYGRNIGIAFQLIDDLLDFSQTAENLGKPAAADLRLGLATAPVLFACQKHKFLHDMILRRFKKPGDVERTLDAVRNSDGLEGTHLLAQQYCMDAKRHLNILVDSEEKDALSSLADLVLNRKK